MPIFDQGYQHWRGPLSGHLWRWLTIARQGARVQWKNRSVRVLLFLAWLPAVALVGFMGLWGFVEKKSESILAFAQGILPSDIVADPIAYRMPVWTLAFSNFFKTEMIFIMLLVAVAGRGLISSDLRFNALPLYLSRPLTRLDYFLGKLGVIGALVASVAVGPAVLAYVVGICFSLDPGVFKDTWKVLLASIAYGLIVTVSAGTLVLAISSLTRQSMYVGMAWAALWIISGSIAAPLSEVHRATLRRKIYEEEMQRWVKEHPPPPGIQAPNVFLPHRRMPVPKGAPPIQVRLRQDGDWEEQWENASDKAMVNMEKRQAEELRKDWRPLCSYVANLERLQEELLDTDAAWVMLGKASTRAQRMAGMAPAAAGGQAERSLADSMVPQYPWQWSAGILAGLLGISVWILTSRVKSLDRLK
jgi:hypothetical protein